MDPADLLAALKAPAGHGPAGLLKAGSGAAAPSDFARWQAAYRLAAHADDHASMALSLDRFGLDVRPTDMVEGTIDFVAACMALSKLDGLPLSPFVNWQLYQPSTLSGAVYTVTFDVHQRGAARLVAGPWLQGIHLAGLYGMPWPRHGLLGYERFWIARIDRDDIRQVERDQIERRISADLRFDYAADEVDFHVDARSVDRALLVYVRDHLRG